MKQSFLSMKHTLKDQCVGNKFNTTGSINNKKSSGPKIKATEEVQAGVLGEFVIDPHKSIRAASLEVGISKSTVHRVLAEEQIPPLQSRTASKIKRGDPDRRIEFCEEMLSEIENDLNITFKTCFSESHFLPERICKPAQLPLLFGQ